jgi:Trp operon repressor
MPHLSKRVLDNKSQEIFYSALVESLSNNSRSDTKEILPLLLTETEQKMISKRLITIYLLDKGEGLLKIANATKTTAQTVSRNALLLKLVNSKAKTKLFSKINKWKNVAVLKNLLSSLLNTNISYSAQVRALRGHKKPKSP